MKLHYYNLKSLLKKNLNGGKFEMKICTTDFGKICFLINNVLYIF